jgi:hypothetical protein
MAQRTHAGDERTATESKFYLPVGVTPSIYAGLVERVRAMLSTQYGAGPE